MRRLEGYCFTCGEWRELPYLKAICSQCREYKPADQRETH